MGTGKRFDGYGRVSRRQGRTGPAYISPTVQREGVQRWADYAGITLDQWHFDEDKTGRNQARPGMREAIRRVEDHEVDGIVCLKLNRFARNVSGALADIQRIRDAGGEIVFVEEQVDTTGPAGKLMLVVLLAVAEWEHENLTMSFIEAKRRAVARGAYVSRTPFGYQRQPDGTLAPHPVEAQIVAETFRLGAGDSLHAALEYLRRAVPHRRWTATTARRLLSGRSYLGETRNGDMVQTDTHEPLVSRAVWEAAQTTPTSRRASEAFPLSGLLACGSCGQPMIGSRGGKGQRTYRCSSTRTEKRCERGAVITASNVEQHVRQVAGQLLGSLRASISDPDVDALTLLERAVADAEAELDAFAGDLQIRRALGDRYHTHLQSRVEALDRAQAAYRAKAREAQTELTLRSADVLAEDDPQLFALALRSIFARVVVEPGRGLAVADRVRFVPVDADGSTGVAGPEGAE